MSEQPEVIENTETEVKPVNWKEEYFALLKATSQLGLQMQVNCNNAEAQLLQREAQEKA